MPFFPTKSAPTKVPEQANDAKKDLPKKPPVEAPDKKEQKSQPDHQQKATNDKNEASQNFENEDLQMQRQSRDSQNKQTQQQRSDYKQSQQFTHAQKTTQNFGHKINVNTQVAKQTQQSTAEQNKSTSEFTRDNPAKPQTQTQQKMPPMPSKEAYRNLVQRHMSQNLQGSQLHKSMQQKMLMDQTTRQAAQARDTSKPLTKAEILQLFSMRNKGDKEKQDIRSILKYELAKTKNQMRQKVQSIRYQNQSNRQQTKETNKSQLNKIDAVKNQIAQRLQNSAGSSRFEQVLQKVLAGGKNVANLQSGVKARFAVKSDWNQFFQNVKSLSSAEMNFKGELNKMIEAIFRGLFEKSGASGKTLVADLAFSEGGEVADNKFAQLQLKDAKILQALEKLQPGDVIPLETLKKMGGDLDFIKLIHLTEATILTEAQKKEILRQFKHGNLSKSEKELQRLLLEQKQNRSKKGKLPFEYAGHLHDAKERYPGPPKFFMYMIYAVLGIGLCFVIYLLLNFLS